MQVIISAPNKTAIGITDDGRLIVSRNQISEQKPEIDFGPATKEKFREVISYLERLSVNAIDV